MLSGGRNVFLQPRKHGAAGLVSVHRLAIFDAEGNVVNIISQLDILRRAPCPGLHCVRAWPGRNTHDI